MRVCQVLATALCLVVVTVRSSAGAGVLHPPRNPDLTRVAAAPDLVVKAVDRQAVTGDWQTLAVAGRVTAEIANEGDAVAAGPITITFFEDANRNARFDSNVDTVLGTAAQGALGAQGSAQVSTQVSGTVTFRHNLIYAFVDSDGAVAESDEGNNLSNSGLACERRPTPGGFAPVLEWEWTGSTTLPQSRQVVITPSVIDLNADGVPDIVFVSFTGIPPNAGAYEQDGHLRAVRGDGTGEIFTVTDPQYDLRGNTGLAVGDIDGDGRPEILAMHESLTRLLAFEHDGTFKWQSDSFEPRLGSPAIADLDRDGTPEIVLGSKVLNNDGTLRWAAPASTPALGRGANAGHDIPLAADLNLSGGLEVVAGNTAYHADGSIFWHNQELTDGYNAVADFDDDPFPEVVLVTKRQVYLLEHDGTVAWGPVLLPGGSNANKGGPPTIADVDSDGEPEVGVAGGSYYTVFETDGTVKWKSPIQDETSNVTGSSVFDFEGDGAAEVIYSDERLLRIYGGTDGRVLWSTPSSSSTQLENPLIVDVDADGSAEIVMVSNDFAFRGTNGIQVYGDANDTWVRTRQIWNQHAYHINNVNDDGTIPRREVPSWLSHNTYRLNLPETGSVFAAPDPTASRIVVDTSGYPTSIILTARIGNGGAVDLGPGMPVAFYEWDGAGPAIPNLIGTTATSGTLVPGEFEDVSVAWNAPRSGTVLIGVVANDDGTGSGPATDCDETNNAHRIAFLIAPTPTSTPTPTPTPTPSPTPTLTPTPPPTSTATPRPAPTAAPPAAFCICDVVRQRVPAVVIQDAVANPERYFGWQYRLDPGKPPGPNNPPRECLTLQNVSLHYHPFWNKPLWRVGCP